MTKEEAIAYGKRVIDLGLNDETQAFCEMAIKALEQEPCEDAISRQAVLDINENHHGQMPNHINHQIWQKIKDLPPVTPQPKMGRWEYVQYDYNPKLGNWHCSECRSVVIECVDKNEKGGIPMYKYCPQCGAKMQEVTE